jgi:hypothetical protein
MRIAQCQSEGRSRSTLVSSDSRNLSPSEEPAVAQGVKSQEPGSVSTLGFFGGSARSAICELASV